MPRAPATIIFITVLLDLLGFGMVLPLMPLYAIDHRFAASNAEVGWLMAIFSLMQFLFAPFWGTLSDRIGRRPVLLIGLFGSSLSYLVYGLAQSLLLLMVARAMAGVMGANIAAAQAAMADITTPDKRAHGMGLIGAAFSIGFIFGPALGGLLSQHGIETAPLFAALITGMNGLAALFLLPETRHLQTATTTSRGHPFSSQLWQNALLERAALPVCVAMGLFITCFSGFEVALPLWGQHALGWEIDTLGWVFTFVGVVMVVVQGGLVRRLAPRFGERLLSEIGLGLVAMGLVLLALFGGTPLHWLALAAVAAGAGLVHPGFSALVSLNTSPERQGAMMGLFQSLSALGRVLGPVLGGVAFGLLDQKLFLVLALGVALLLLTFRLIRHQMRDARQTAPPR